MAHSLSVLVAQASGSAYNILCGLMVMQRFLPVRQAAETEATGMSETQQHHDRDSGQNKNSHAAYSNPQKKRAGIRRVAWAFCYSMRGLRFGLSQPAFLTECLFAAVLLPCALWVGKDWQGVVLLWAVTVLVLVAEMLNTALELLVDRVSPEWSEMAKNAKDAGSAAVFLTLLLCTCAWAAAIYSHLY